MKTFLIGVVVGVILSTVGFTGVLKIVDNSVEAVKVQSKQLTK